MMFAFPTKVAPSAITSRLVVRSPISLAEAFKSHLPVTTTLPFTVAEMVQVSLSIFPVMSASGATVRIGPLMLPPVRWPANVISPPNLMDPWIWTSAGTLLILFVVSLMEFQVIG